MFSLRQVKKAQKAIRYLSDRQGLVVNATFWLLYPKKKNQY
jgi:hypothetical protein